MSHIFSVIGEHSTVIISTLVQKMILLFVRAQLSKTKIFNLSVIIIVGRAPSFILCLCGCFCVQPATFIRVMKLLPFV